MAEPILRAPALVNGAYGVKAATDGARSIADAFTGYGERIKKRATNNAINELLGATPGQGTEGSIDKTTGKFTPGMKAQTAFAFDQQQRQKFSEIEGIDPLKALGLAKAQAAPLYEQEVARQKQSNADRLFGFDQTKEKNLQTYRDDTIGTKTVDTGTGQRYGFNPKSSKYDIKIGGPTPNTNIGGIKGNGLVSVSNRDSFGNETTKQVQKYIIGPNGEVIVNPETQGLKRPVLDQKDNDFLSTVEGGYKGLNEFSDIVTKGDEQVFGKVGATEIPIPFTNFTPDDVGAFFETEASDKRANFDARSSKFLADATKQLTGALSEKEMELIQRQIPTTGDSAIKAQQKMDSIRPIILRGYQRKIQSYWQSNPEASKHIPYQEADGTLVFMDGSRVKNGKRVQ